MISLNESTYMRLKEAIMTFELRPGDTISAQKIAVRLGVSRTPAREAIVKLEQEGLLIIIPKSGTIVSKINMNRAKQEWFVRKTLEVGMVEDFIKNCSDATIKEMEEAISKIEKARSENDMPTVELDNEFHNIIYTCSGQILAKEIINTQMSSYNRLRYLSEKTYSSERDSTVNEHRELLQMAINKDVNKYRKSIEEHLYRIEQFQTNLKEIYPMYFDN